MIKEGPMRLGGLEKFITLKVNFQMTKYFIFKG